MAKKEKPERNRREFASRVQAVIDAEPYGTLYAFQKAHPALGGRVATWVLPQRRRAKPRRVDLAALVMPDALSLLEFCSATGLSADWLLGLSESDSPLYANQTRSKSTLENDVAEHVRREVSERVSAAPLSDRAGDWSPRAQHIECTPHAGRHLLNVAVDAAEADLRMLAKYEREIGKYAHAYGVAASLPMELAKMGESMGKDERATVVRLISSLGQALQSKPDMKPPNSPLRYSARPVTTG